MTTITLPIKCFGIFRKFGDSLDLDVPSGSSISQIKTELIRRLGEQHKGLVEDSVLANETDILPDAFVVKASANLCILPPVCGG